MSLPPEVGASQTPDQRPLSIDEGWQRVPLFPTQNHLSEDVRTFVTERLNRTLADTTILMMQAKFAHWNVKGMAFYSLHQLFDEIAEGLERHVDQIAEITGLGGQARGTAGMAVARCTIRPMPTDAAAGEEYVRLLTDRMTNHTTNLFDDIEAATSYGDINTADMLNEISREVSQYQWFLDAHLQS
jgi:starvation-inducible DNA-binding protein